MQIPLLSGIASDQRADFRSQYPVNLMPVPKETGISKGYLHSAGGVRQQAFTIIATPDVVSLTGPDRGAINWKGAHYRVIGDAFVRLNADATLEIIARVPNDGRQVSLDYSFDRLAIASAGSLYYYDGVTFSQVTDADLGTVVDMMWLGGYFFCTDGTSLIVTDLTDPTMVNPLKYGSSEVDPDPVLAVRSLLNEAYAFNRYTVQAFQNVGGTGFPFALIPGALISRGVIGTHAVDQIEDAFAFIGSGRNEQPSVWLGGNGQTTKIATREIEQLLKSFTEEQLAQVVCETREHDGHMQFYMHLPSITAIYDVAASATAGEPVWSYLSSSITAAGAYVFRNFVWVHDRWYCGSTSSTAQIGYIDDGTMTQAGGILPGWQFDTQLFYNEGRGLIIHDLELVTLGGRIDSSGFADDFVDWQIALQFTLDGLTWSQKHFASIGKAGQTLKRVAWRTLGALHDCNWLGLRFTGQHPVPVSFARIEARIEPLN